MSIRAMHRSWWLRGHQQREKEQSMRLQGCLPYDSETAPMRASAGFMPKQQSLLEHSLPDELVTALIFSICYLAPVADPCQMANNLAGEPTGADSELYSEVLRAQSKSFYIDLKENARGRYIKIAEKGRYRPKSSIVIPISGLAQFLQVLRYFLAEAMQSRLGQPRDIIIESKVFSFSAGSNERGQYLRIFESGGGYPSGGSSLMIPCGWSNTYLKMFCDSLEKIGRQVSQDGSMGPDFERLLSSMESVSSLPAPDSVVLDSKEGGPVLSVGSKHFFFELRSNERGQYLKVKEVSGSMKQLLVIPSHAIKQFQEAISLALLSLPQADDASNGGVSSSDGGKR